MFPSAFVLVLAYSESLMLVASIGAFLGACGGDAGGGWPRLGLVAALSRPLGVVLVVPALVEVVRGLARGSTARDRWRRWPRPSAPRWSGWRSTWRGWATCSATGACRSPCRTTCAAAWRFPFDRVIEGFRQLAGSERFGDGLHLPFLLVLLVLLVLTFRTWPLSYGLYAAAILVAALSAENLNSIERYGMSAFPLVLALAVVMPPAAGRAGGAWPCWAGDWWRCRRWPGWARTCPEPAARARRRRRGG